MRLSPPFTICAVVAIALAGLALERRARDDRTFGSVQLALNDYNRMVFKNGRDLWIRERNVVIDAQGAIEFVVSVRPAGSDERTVVARKTTRDVETAGRIFVIVKPMYAASVSTRDEGAIKKMIFGEGRGGGAGIRIHRCSRGTTDIPSVGVVFDPSLRNERLFATPVWCDDAFSQTVRQKLDKVRNLAVAALQRAGEAP